MLKQRLFTAIILIPLIVWVLSLSSQTLAYVISIFVILGGYEWAGICGWHSNITRSIYTTAMSLVLLIFYWFWHQPTVMYILLVACLWWLVALYWVLHYQYGSVRLPKTPFIKALLGFLILPPAAIALLILHKHESYGWHWVIFLLVLIWVADSSAYFVGRRWGKIKLADRISPKKTWEGVVSALLFSSIVSLGYAVFNSMSLMRLFWFVLLCLATVIVSIVGDLFESLFKRQVGLKDSSRILPGHGGILDRIDSLTAAAPIFVIGLISLEKVF